MKKQKNTLPHYVTEEILKKELSETVKQLDAKIDASTQSMKDYTDSRFTQLDTKVDGLTQKMETRFDKFEHYFEELTGMFVQQNKKIDTSLKQLKNHEQRITKLEEHTA